MSDLRFAVRTLAKTPVISAVAVLSLALGIGANSAMFSLFDQILMKPLAVHAPEGLVNLRDEGPKMGSSSANDSGGPSYVFSAPMLRDLEKSNVFEGVAGFRNFGANVAFRGQTSSSLGLFVSGQYFGLLGLQATAGRLLGPGDDEKPGGHPVVVLSHKYWENKLGSRTDVLGQTMTVNGKAMTIVGVGPQEFTSTSIGLEPDLYAPLAMREALTPGWTGLAERMSYWVYLFGRLKPGMSMEQAQTAINVVYTGIIKEVDLPLQKSGSKTYMDRFKAKQLVLESGRLGFGSLRRDSRPVLGFLLAITGFVLLIACANIANLLLARAANRSREISIRLSVGASRWQLIRQLLTESMVLAMLGGLGGILVSRWTLYGMVSMMPAEGQAFFAETTDWRVLLFTLGISLLTGLMFGIFPALHSTSPDLSNTLKDQAGQVSASGAAARFRSTLVTAQIGLSLVLLISAGLFLKSLVNIARVELGIRTSNLITFGISPDLSGYTPQRALALVEKLEGSLAAIPGVSGVTGATVPLVAGDNHGTNVTVDGFVAGPDTDMDSMINEVGPNFFSTVGMTLLAGREFTAADNAAGPKVAVINEAFARKFNLGSGTAPIGKRMRRGASAKEPNDITIVGVAKNATYSSVKDAVPPLFYTPFRQRKDFGSVSLYVRTALPPEQIIPLVRRAVANEDSQLPIENLKTMETQIKENVFVDRMITTQASAFALLATLLAAVGLYGVLAYSVARRTREFGIRLALGADAASVRNMVLREVTRMVVIGTVVGIPAALGLARLFASELYKMEVSDPLVVGSATIAMALVALLAGYVPALRATRIDPMHALRYE
ncbi:hypothetical protein F183_A26370 [Bryobacterales bacterium F-183]|nr:hypothetical protein F183_A26370 [Bryobacterales bacterium F-183]